MRHPRSYCALVSFFVLVAAPPAASAATYEAALLAGTHGGVGGSAQLLLSDFSSSFDGKARLGATYSTRDAGKPEDARRIFINDATNGTPRESGRLWTLSLDLLFPVWEGEQGAVIHAFFGPRYGSFTGNFVYVGGNEDFDIREKTWAFGAGLEDRLPLGARTELVLQGGVDYYLAGKLNGHDTTYAPDDENVNSRNDFDYADADEAVNQPKLEARAMVGVAVRLGR